MFLASQGHLLCTTTRRLQRQKAKCSLKPMWGQIQAFLRIWQSKEVLKCSHGETLGMTGTCWRRRVTYAHILLPRPHIRGNRHWVAKDFGELRKVLRCRWEWWFATMIRIVWHLFCTETWRKTSAKSRKTGAISRKTRAKSKSVQTHALKTHIPLMCNQCNMNICPDGASTKKMLSHALLYLACALFLHQSMCSHVCFCIVHDFGCSEAWCMDMTERGLFLLFDGWSSLMHQGATCCKQTSRSVFPVFFLRWPRPLQKGS